MYKFIFIIGCIAIIFISAKPYKSPVLSTKQEQLIQTIDSQVIEYDKARAIYNAIQAKNDTEELRKATEVMQTAADKAKKARLELCKNFSIIRAAGNYNVKAQSCSMYQ